MAELTDAEIIRTMKDAIRAFCVEAKGKWISHLYRDISTDFRGEMIDHWQELERRAFGMLDELLKTHKEDE